MNMSLNPNAKKSWFYFLSTSIKKFDIWTNLNLRFGMVQQ